MMQLSEDLTSTEIRWRAGKVDEVGKRGLSLHTSRQGLQDKSCCVSVPERTVRLAPVGELRYMLGQVQLFN